MERASCQGKPTTGSCSAGLPCNSVGVPNGIRTRVLALKGPRPRPLDDGDAQVRQNTKSYHGGGTVVDAHRRIDQNTTPTVEMSLAARSDAVGKASDDLRARSSKTRSA